MWRTISVKYSAGHVAEAALGSIWAALHGVCYIVSIVICCASMQ